MKGEICNNKMCNNQQKGLTMLDLDEISRRLQDRVLSVVADATGLHRNTLAAIRSGKKTSVNKTTIAILSTYLVGQDDR